MPIVTGRRNGADDLQALRQDPGPVARLYANVARYAGGDEKILYFPGWPEPVFSTSGGEPEPAGELAPWQGMFKVMFAGNLGQAQDIPVIIAAADLLRDEPNLRWIIVGDGRAGADAREEVARRGLEGRVIFAGRYPIERMPSFFAAADALLVSLRDEPIWSLTIPGKVQSYLASGKPVVAMLNGEGARVIAESGGGVAGPAGDAAALAENVRTLMAMPVERRAEIGQAGRAYCQREFDRAQLVNKLEGWIEELGN
ncbi:glycosyltransferase family 4 protein [Sphingomonas sp. J344]|nr:glycosyltransferase family 4 protein [Sphingomonas sp. J344]MCR5871133.1 glycosyltransferase family 4 protein [Sphingomonas sp. J344]